MSVESKNEKNEAEKPRFDTSSDGLSALAFTLKIGFDGKRATTNLTGLGNYSRSLIGQLADRFPANRYYIFSPKISEKLAKLSLFKHPAISLQHYQGISPSFLWRSFGIIKSLKELGVQIYHGLSHEIPFGLKKAGIKSIVTIHDLIFLVKPQYYRSIDRIIYRFKSKYACENADRIIAISEQTKRDIIHFFGISPQKIQVIYQSCDDQFKRLLEAKEKAAIRKRYSLPEQYLLSVGTIEERKNLLLLIKAMEHLNPDIKLVVIGKETAYAKLVHAEINRLSLRERIIFLRNVPFSDLPAIYQSATIFIYPSLYEGFGIPIIEAAFGKTPVIAATGSCLEEAGGPDSIYINPQDILGLADAIKQLWENKDLAISQAEKTFRYVQRFNDAKISQDLMNCYQSLLK